MNSLPEACRPFGIAPVDPWRQGHDRLRKAMGIARKRHPVSLTQPALSAQLDVAIVPWLALPRFPPLDLRLSGAIKIS
jgi:hypothetical protein